MTLAREQLHTPTTPSSVIAYRRMRSTEEGRLTFIARRAGWSPRFGRCVAGGAAVGSAGVVLRGVTEGETADGGLRQDSGGGTVEGITEQHIQITAHGGPTPHIAIKHQPSNFPTASTPIQCPPNTIHTIHMFNHSISYAAAHHHQQQPIASRPQQQNSRSQTEHHNHKPQSVHEHEFHFT